MLYFLKCNETSENLTCLLQDGLICEVPAVQFRSHLVSLALPCHHKERSDIIFNELFSCGHKEHLLILVIEKWWYRIAVF